MSTAVLKDVARALRRASEQSAYALRSSTTAEDLPAASFVGLRVCHLNMVGFPCQT